MDYLLTGIVVALICLSAWLFYKRWAGRYKNEQPEDYEEDYEEDQSPAPPETVKEPPPAEPIPEPGTTSDKKTS